MTESGKFGGSRLQFGDTTPGSQAGDTAECASCEAMLADALDGTLSAADQALFDRHTAACAPCRQLLAEAQRGAAWLQMIHAEPEPPASLAERILAQTGGAVASATLAHAPAGSGQPLSVGPAAVIPFRERVWAALRRSGLGQIALQPRLAMTAAMAFFSLALTMDITGLRVQDVKPANFRPSNLKRGLYTAKARLVQSYEGLRVVYELESRVRDMESVGNDNVQNGGTRSAPALRQPSNPAPAPAQQPGNTPPQKKGSNPDTPSGVPRAQAPGSRASQGRYSAGHALTAQNSRPRQAGHTDSRHARLA